MGLSAQTINDKNKPLILVVDKIGLLGERLALFLSQDYLVIFVSRQIHEQNKNIIHIPFKGKIPQVPDNKYEKLFIVDDGSSVTRDSVISFIALARGSSSNLYFLTGIRNIDSNHAEAVTSEYAGVRVLIFGDLFDRKLFFDKNSSINRFILQARKNRKIDVPGAGLSLSFPVTLEDTVKLALKAAHLNLAQKILLLFPQSPVTDISLAHIFQKIDPDITIDYAKEIKDKKIYVPQGGEHVITKYDLEQKIKELDLENPENRKITLVEGKSERKNFLKPFLLILLILLFILLLPLISTLGYSSLGYFELNNAKSQIDKGNLDGAKGSVDKSKTFFETSAKTAGILISESRYLRLLPESQGLRQKISSANDLSGATASFLDGAMVLRSLYKGNSLDAAGDFQTASNSFKSALVLSQKVEAEGAMPEDFREKISKLKPLIDLFANSSEVLPQVLGFDKGKTYLVLFENDHNARPGGGHIDSVGLLKIKNAKVQSFSTQDSASLDQKFNQHVEPPYALRRYVPEINWKLGESNFSPDFIRSAISASNFYSIESGEKVDGVIAVNSTFLKNILELTGPISSKNQTVSADSLPGLISSEDGTFLGKVGESIFSKLRRDKSISVFKLAQKTGDSVVSKDVLFAFKDEGVQNVFSANNWSGSLSDDRGETADTINDSLGLYEANLGVKNPDVSRSLSKKTIIGEDGGVSSRLQIAYKNSSTKDNYKNYVQLVLPQGSKINSIRINNTELPVQKAVTDFFVYESKGFKAPQGVEVNETTELGKSVFGFLLNIPPGQVQTVAVDYDLPKGISKDQNSATYSLKLYKQPGIEAYPFDLFLDFPDNYHIISGQNPMSATVNKDGEYIYKISQK